MDEMRQFKGIIFSCSLAAPFRLPVCLSANHFMIYDEHDPECGNTSSSVVQPEKPGTTCVTLAQLYSHAPVMSS